MKEAGDLRLGRAREEREEQDGSEPENDPEHGSQHAGLLRGRAGRAARSAAVIRVPSSRCVVGRPGNGRLATPVLRTSLYAAGGT